MVKDTSTFTTAASINRSQSLLATNDRIPVLAPSRGERARLEAILSDVWTRDVLPFPGITVRSRSEHIVRASASSVMRKLSVASIAGNFAKRSASTTSLHRMNTGEEETPPSFRRARTAAARPSISADGHRRSYEMPEDGSQLLLSVIPDESERYSSCDALAMKAESEWAVDVFRTVRRLDSVRMAESNSAVGARTNTPVSVEAGLRTSPTNDLRQRRHGREDRPPASLREAPSARALEKENNMNGAPSCCQSSQDSFKSQKIPSSRWIKLRSRHREGVAQGFRSLFR